MDISLAFPPLILAMAIASFIGPDLNNAMLAIAVVHVPKYTRLARGEALALREQLYMVLHLEDMTWPEAYGGNQAAVGMVGAKVRQDLRMGDLTANGALGVPRRAFREIGEAVLRLAEDRLVEFLKDFVSGR